MGGHFSLTVEVPIGGIMPWGGGLIYWGDSVDSVGLGNRIEDGFAERFGASMGI